jgi:hypothetical protein
MASQYCVSCERECCKLKLGQDQDWKIRLEHYTPEKVGQLTGIDSPAMCSDCVNAKKKGYKKFLNGKHFSLSGKLLMSKKQEIESLELDIERLEIQQSEIQIKLDRKRKALQNFSTSGGK